MEQRKKINSEIESCRARVDAIVAEARAKELEFNKGLDKHAETIREKEGMIRKL